MEALLASTLQDDSVLLPAADDRMQVNSQIAITRRIDACAGIISFFYSWL
jgi:hypothetical protein